MMFDTARDRVRCELAWSPDTVAWERIEPGRPLIADADEREAYDWGCVYAAEPLFPKNEIRLYYGASNGPHTSWRDGFLALATLRPDGFAGFETAAAGSPGFVITKPVFCSGRHLLVSADAAHGTLRASLLGDTGQRGVESAPITANVTDQEVRWSGSSDLAAYAGKTIRLRFELADAKLYSFSFAD
jgi:hypothetical protein